MSKSLVIPKLGKQNRTTTLERLRVLNSGWAQLVLALVGIYITWMLSFAKLFGLMLPCGTSHGCELVAESPASSFMGIPLALIGLGFYVVLGSLAWKMVTNSTLRIIRVGFAMSLTGAIISTYLSWYSVTIVGAKCAWCMSSNADMCLLTLSFALADGKSASQSRFLNSIRNILTLIAVLSLCAGSYGLWRSDRFATVNETALHKLSVDELIPNDALTLNPKRNELTIIVFADLFCPTCHLLLPDIIHFARKSGAKLVVRYCPQPIHPGSYEASIFTQQAAMRGNGWSVLEAACNADVKNLRQFEGLKEFENCRSANWLSAQNIVDRDLRLARKLGIVNTPTILVSNKNGVAEAKSIHEFSEQYIRVPSPE